MHNLVKQVFQILGILMLSMILWGIIFGSVGRTFMWNAIEPAMQSHWASITMRDGKIVSEAVKGTFNAAKEFNIR